MSEPEAVTLWRDLEDEWLDWTPMPASCPVPENIEVWRALPAAQYAALVAERDALREALAGLVKAEQGISDTNGTYQDFLKAMNVAITALGAERRE